MLKFKIYPTHDKTYNKTCATSEDSDQHARPRSLIRVFAYRTCLRLIRVFAGHTGLIVGFVNIWLRSEEMALKRADCPFTIASMIHFTSLQSLNLVISA